MKPAPGAVSYRVEERSEFGLQLLSHDHSGNLDLRLTEECPASPSHTEDQNILTAVVQHILPRLEESIPARVRWKPIGGEIGYAAGLIWAHIRDVSLAERMGRPTARISLTGEFTKYDVEVMIAGSSTTSTSSESGA